MPSATEYVFASGKTGTRIKEIKTALKNACRAAGISDLRWHDLRHTFGTRLGGPAIPPTGSPS